MNFNDALDQCSSVGGMFNLDEVFMIAPFLHCFNTPSKIMKKISFNLS